MDALRSVAELEGAVGKRPPGWHVKTIPVLDDHCLDYLARTPFVLLGIEDADGTQRSVPIGGDPGIVEPLGRDRVRLHLDHADFDGAPSMPDGAPAGLIALVPGYRETLRVNGRLHGTELIVEEAFLHCAKCMIRSRLWDDDAVAGSGPVVDDADLDHHDVAEFLARSPFAFLVSSDAAGHVDVSPKGDPAGFIVTMGKLTLAIPDRPGNKRTDTFHNLLENPEISLLAMVPGDDRVLRVRGRAMVTDDPELRSRSVVRGNTPAAMLVIEAREVSLSAAKALNAARLWDPGRRVDAGDLPRASEIWKDHIKVNNDPGLAARLARTGMTERLMRAGLALDYKNNLY